MDRDDPTIPDRLILRALIEDDLPRRAREQGWPVNLPSEFARLIFDPLFGVAYEVLVREPVFENFPAVKLRPAIAMAESLLSADAPRVAGILAVAGAFRRHVAEGGE